MEPQELNSLQLTAGPNTTSYEEVSNALDGQDFRDELDCAAVLASLAENEPQGEA